MKNKKQTVLILIEVFLLLLCIDLYESNVYRYSLAKINSLRHLNQNLRDPKDTDSEDITAEGTSTTNNTDLVGDSSIDLYTGAIFAIILSIVALLLILLIFM